MASQPQAHPRMLSSFDLVAAGMTEIVITGDRPDLVEVAHRRFLPTSVVLHGEAFDSPVWAGRTGDRAYVCRNYTCQLPSDDAESFIAQIRAATT